MTTQELIRQVEALGCQLIASGGDRLQLTNPSRLPPELIESLRKHKPALLEAIRPRGWQVVPPADLPLNPIEPRPTPANRELVIAYAVRQCAPHHPMLAWLSARECQYYDGPGRHWDCGLLAFAAARDCAQWQLGCESEFDLLEKLAGFDDAAPGWC